ncbi:MAG: glutathione S-transferase N-terminal domain-containing protein, partial [Pseudomonas sp.]|nr:glutathione S-transferase N-terminal domain-containing protein [Pseudomonas sp.]
MQLIYAAASPFARKVRVLAAETGLLERIELFDTAVLPTRLTDRVTWLNPLVKIPVVLTDAGRGLFEARGIR